MSASRRHFILIYQPFDLAPGTASCHRCALLHTTVFSFRQEAELEICRLLAATRPPYPSPNGSEQPLNGATVGSPVGDEYLWEDTAQKKPLRRTAELSFALLLQSPAPLPDPRLRCPCDWKWKMMEI